MRTIVYYGRDGEAAVRRVSHLRALHGNDAAQAICSGAFVGERIKADEIEFMGDVPGWQRSKIEDYFARQKQRDAEIAEEEARKREGLPPQRIVDEEAFRRSLTSRPTTAPQPVEPAPAPHPLDHDGDGRKGGSLPKAKRGKKAKAE